MPYAKNHIRVNVPKMSGFDQTHRNSGTAFVGSLIPLLTQEVIPGRKSLRLPINVQLPPLVSDTYMNLEYKVEAFFVPSRLCCRSFEKFFCDFPANVATSQVVSGSATILIDDVPGRVPLFYLGASLSDGVDCGPGSLLDYMGMKTDVPSSGGDWYNMMPLIAYHLIWQEWYRNPRVQKPAFVDNLGITSFANAGDRLELISAPYTFFHAQYTPSGGSSSVANNYFFSFTEPDSSKLADDHSLFKVRQRNFPLDYYTGARVSPQQGLASAVSFTTDGVVDEDGDVTSSGSFTIAQLRAANSLQQFRERNNIPSPRLVDQVKARYGANLSDGVAQRPVCIGTASYDVQSNGVLQNGGDAAGTNVNPFATIGAQYGRAGVSGNDFIIDDFTVAEPGYIIVLGSLVPKVTYTSGILPLWKRYVADGSITDMACSILQNVGDQPVMSRELSGARVSGPQLVFGYQDRYADWMFHPNECHGLMREGQSLSSFVLQRDFMGDSPVLSSQFLEIPTDYLDGVMQFASATIGLSYWYDALVEFKETMPLAEFSIPSLQDPAYEHGHSVSLRRNGQIF